MGGVSVELRIGGETVAEVGRPFCVAVGSFRDVVGAPGRSGTVSWTAGAGGGVLVVFSVVSGVT